MVMREVWWAWRESTFRVGRHANGRNQSIRGCRGFWTTLDGQRRQLASHASQGKCQGDRDCLGECCRPGEWALLNQRMTSRGCLENMRSCGCISAQVARSCHGPVPLFLSPVHQFEGKLRACTGKECNHPASKEPKIHSSGAGGIHSWLETTIQPLRHPKPCIRCIRARIGWESARRQFGMNGMPLQKPSKPMHNWSSVGYTAKLKPEGIQTTLGMELSINITCMRFSPSRRRWDSRSRISGARRRQWLRAWDACQTPPKHLHGARVFSRTELKDKLHQRVQNAESAFWR